MPILSKILGQIKPGAGLETILYTVQVDTQAQINVWVAEQAGTPTQVKVALTKAGFAVAATDYICYNLNIDGYETLSFTGLALDEGDYISVTSASGACSFVASGLEIT